MIKNIIDYITVPHKTRNINLLQLTPIINWLKDFDLNISGNWYTFSDKYINISISNTSIIMVSLRINPQYTERAMVTLNKISKKIRSFILLDDYHLEIYILENRNILTELNYGLLNLEPNSVLQISNYDGKTVISLKNCNNIEKLIGLYSTILDTKTDNYV